jgi:uncharacterized protein with PIN domain
VIFIIVVGLPKKDGDTRIIRCPFCLWRLCDAVVNEPERVVAVLDNNDSHLIMKCHKCGRLIGIALIFNKA